MKKLYAFIAMWLLAGSAFAQVLVNETFENGNTVGQTPVGWIGDGGWKAGIIIPDDNEARGRKPHTGDWYMYATYNTDVWIYKEINVTAGNYYRVSFWYATWHVDHFNLEVKAGANSNPSAMTETAVPMMVIANEDFEQTSGVFQATNSGSFYVGFHSVADNGPWYLSIDDIIIEQTAQYNFIVEQLTADTSVYFGEPAYLRFRLNNTGEQSDTYQFNSTGNLPVEFYQNGTLVTQVNVPYNSSVELIAKTTLPMNLNNNEVVHATFDVVSSHSAPTQSADFAITALAPYADFPLEEGFENDFVPFGWQNNITNGNYAFDRITEGSTPSATPHEGSQYMARFYTYTNPSGGSAELVSPKMNLNEHGCSATATRTSTRMTVSMCITMRCRVRKAGNCLVPFTVAPIRTPSLPMWMTGTNMPSPSIAPMTMVSSSSRVSATMAGTCILMTSSSIALRKTMRLPR